MDYEFNFIEYLMISTLKYDIRLPFETAVWSKNTLKFMQDILGFGTLIHL